MQRTDVAVHKARYAWHHAMAGRWCQMDLKESVLRFVELRLRVTLAESYCDCYVGCFEKNSALDKFSAAGGCVQWHG